MTTFNLTIGVLTTLIITAVNSATASCLFQSENCIDNCCPSQTPISNVYLNRSAYALSANIETKFADWVAYRVISSNIGGKTQRKWRQDPKIDPNSTLSPRDYLDAHMLQSYDRGHQAPLGHFGNSPDSSWKETNYLSNITPQKSQLNQGPWQKLELKERELSKRGHVLYVLTGTLYESYMPVLPFATISHQIPSSYWKIILSKKDNKTTEISAFIMPQTAQRYDSFCSYEVSLDEVLSRTQLHLFSDTSEHSLTKGLSSA
ncbi:DNA/RNA non-specific endonuclease [Cysteiniphilum sp. JM-1]|uniref:DNA/RNA non-specific endonuclease n=1 Tax=Cysteiniphilum sp. JM-1 TaxID=2610891 RepID=UPI001245813D|nr:DNA/RNA non-specific endonuclease [Cysteiniphilum sp. JM-1]